MSNFLNTKQVAELIGLSEQRVREIVAAGNIAAFKPKGAKGWLFTKKAAADYIGCEVKDL